MASHVRQVELALLERLRVARGYPVHVESYGAQLDDELFSWVRKLPAVWVTFEGIREVKASGRRGRIVSAAFEVLCAQRHLRENEGRLNPSERGSDIGLYELLEDNKLLLAGRKLGLQIQPLEAGPIKSVMKGAVRDEAIAIYAQTFITQWQEMQPEPDLDNASELLRIGLDYLSPINASETEATDLVTLKT